MGRIIRQSSISTIFIYLGVIIGYLNVLWLFPAFLSIEQIGLLRILPSIALLLLPFAQLGLPQSFLKFYPNLKNEEKGVPQLLGFLIVGISIGLLLFGSIVWIFYQSIISYFIDKSSLLVDYFHVVICLVILFSFQTLFEIYIRTLYKIIVLNFIREVLIRLLTSIAVMLYFLEYFTFFQLANSLIIIYTIASSLLLLYLSHLGKLKISFHFNLINKDLLKQIVNYSLYALLGSGGGYILLNIDQIMISSMIGLSENGIYTTAFYTAVIIEMINRPISQISQPLISDSFKKNDICTIGKIYKQTSINQMLIGSLLFIGIICNLNNLYQLMPNSEIFTAGKWIVIIIGAGKLFGMTFGINGQIIVLSFFYRFNIVTIILLAIITILSNYLLIPIYGINGAAIATFLSIIFYNLVKMVFIYYKFHLIPFTVKNLIMLGIIGITFLIGFYFPKMDNVFLDMIIRSIGIIVIFGLLVYYLKISKDINGIIQKAFQIISRKQ